MNNITMHTHNMWSMHTHFELIHDDFWEHEPWKFSKLVWNLLLCLRFEIFCRIIDIKFRNWKEWWFLINFKHKISYWSPFNLYFKLHRSSNSPGKENYSSRWTVDWKSFVESNPAETPTSIQKRTKISKGVL